MYTFVLKFPIAHHPPPRSGVMPGGNRRTHRERRVVPYTPEQFFDVVADVDNYKKFVPFCVDSRVVKVIDEGTMEADMSVGFKVKRDRERKPIRVEGGRYV